MTAYPWGVGRRRARPTPTSPTPRRGATTARWRSPTAPSRSFVASDRPRSRRRDRRPAIPGRAAGHGLRRRRLDVAAAAPATTARSARAPAAQLRYKVTVRPGALARRSGSRSRRRTAGPRPARCATRAASWPRRPAIARALGEYSKVDLPGDRQLQEAVDWGKQNLADLTQTATDLNLRFVDEGKAYPAPIAKIPRSRSSAPATRTTRGCSPPTASTRRSRPSRSASSRRSRRT